MKMMTIHPSVQRMDCAPSRCSSQASTSYSSVSLSKDIHARNRVPELVRENRNRTRHLCRGSDRQHGSTETINGTPTRGSSSSSQHKEQDGSVDRENHPMPYGLITVLASVGALETAYLTLSKLFSAPVSCPTSGSCDTVLSSDYASVFGVPLPLLGFLAYGAVAFIAGRQSMQEATRSQQSLLDGDRARYAVLAGSTALATTSGYLLYLLATVFRGETCVWCLTSAALSFTTFASTLRGFTMRELADSAGPGSGLVASIILGLALAWSNVEAPEAQAGFELQYMEPKVSEASTPRSVELAKRLKAAGAKMYGAFWCSHCFEQKQSFGKEALADLPYVECYPDGYYQGVKLAKECVDANLTGFPAWIINGKRLDGEQTFEKLEAELAQAENVVQ